jgi:hypothetical protein
MNAISKRLEKIERATTPDETESLDLRIVFVEAVDGWPGRKTKDYTVAELAERPEGHAHEWNSRDGGEAA